MRKLRTLFFVGATSMFIFGVGCLDLEAAVGNPADRTTLRERGELDARARSNGLTASILLLKGSPSKGAVSEASQRDVFLSGQRFRLEVNSRLDGFLYVLCRTSTGEARLLYPYGDVEPEDNRLGRGETRMVPETDWYRFDNDPGTENVYVLLSAVPIQELDRAAANSGELSARTLLRYVTPGRGVKSIEVSPADSDEDDDTPRHSAALPDMLLQRIQLNHIR